MARRRASHATKLAWLVLCFAIILNQGCGRPSVIHRTEAAANPPTGEQKLPFHQNPERATDDSAHPAVPPDGKSLSGSPFLAASHSRGLPAGTLITVRLENSLAISQVRPGDAFTASVAGPLTVDGDTLIERSTPVSGRVESAQPSVDRPGLSPDPGYVRLTLRSITFDGRAFGLQTSSLFAKGTIPSSGSSRASFGGNGSIARPGDFRIQKGRRLTFRLTTPVTFADSNSVANRQAPSTSSP